MYFSLLWDSISAFKEGHYLAGFGWFFLGFLVSVICEFGFFLFMAINDIGVKNGQQDKQQNR
jgi:hypothetical protein